MRRVQIHLDDDMDERLRVEAARRGTSKASLVRTLLDHALDASPKDRSDPFDGLVGSLEVQPADIDEVVYGEVRRHLPS